MNLSRFRVLIGMSVFGIAFASALGQSTSTGGSQQPAPGNISAAGPNRPAKVPQGYVITPFGYFHPSCVQSLAKGESLLPDGRVQHADGTANTSVAVCSYPRYTPAGDPVGEAAATASPEISGWVENANVTTGSATTSYGALLAVWTVPPQPLENDGQTLFFFPGLEDINGVQSILQPVMRWYGWKWDIESWNCCLNNIITESPVVDVAPGDLIYGSITNTCRPGTLSCSTWNVLSVDLSTGKSTTLGSTPSDGQVFNWAFGGVMEPYYIVSCKDYPPNHQLTFGFVTVFDQHLHPISDPRWSVSTNTTGTPQCHYDVTPKPGEITLDY
jgi:hypothetical protein